MATMLENLRKMFENAEYYEARHAKHIENPENSENPNAEEEPEEKFTDYVSRTITSLQKTTEDLKAAIEREQEAIKNGNIGSANGMAKINGWQSRLTTAEYKIQMLQKALDAFLTNQNAENERNLKIAALK